jgi:hypothetical protein
VTTEAHGKQLPTNWFDKQHKGGRECEEAARLFFFGKQEFILQSNFVALVGHSIKKSHRFDLGSDEPYHRIADL